MEITYVVGSQILISPSSSASSLSIFVTDKTAQTDVTTRWYKTVDKLSFIRQCKKMSVEMRIQKCKMYRGVGHCVGSSVGQVGTVEREAILELKQWEMHQTLNSASPSHSPLTLHCTAVHIYALNCTEVQYCRSAHLHNIAGFHNVVSSTTEKRGVVGITSLMTVWFNVGGDVHCTTQ